MDLVDHSVDRVLDLLGLPEPRGAPLGWRGGARMKASRRRKRQLVAFQGERGAFSEEAARKLLGASIEVAALPAVRGCFPQPEPEESPTRRVIPIENTLPDRSTRITITCCTSICPSWARPTCASCTI